MLFRFRARNYPHVLSVVVDERWNCYRMERWKGGRAIEDILEILYKIQEKSRLLDVRANKKSTLLDVRAGRKIKPARRPSS